MKPTNSVSRFVYASPDTLEKYDLPEDEKNRLKNLRDSGYFKNYENTGIHRTMLKDWQRMGFYWRLGVLILLL